jgi:hypothetical protein
MERWRIDYKGSKFCLEPSSSTSRSLPVDLPLPLRRSGSNLSSSGIKADPPPRRPHHDDQQVHEEIPCPPRRPNWQGMRGHPHRGPNQQHTRGNDDLFAKVKFMIPPFYDLYDAEAYLDCEMTVDNKFSFHLVPKQHRVRQATSEFKDFAII